MLHVTWVPIEVSKNYLDEGGKELAGLLVSDYPTVTTFLAKY